jgi:hypothetical protein
MTDTVSDYFGEYLVYVVGMAGLTALTLLANPFFPFPLFSLFLQAFSIVALFSGRIRPSLNDIRNGLRAHFDAKISFQRLQVTFRKDSSHSTSLFETTFSSDILLVFSGFPFTHLKSWADIVNNICTYMLYLGIRT